MKKKISPPAPRMPERKNNQSCLDLPPSQTLIRSASRAWHGTRRTAFLFSITVGKVSKLSYGKQSSSMPEAVLVIESSQQVVLTFRICRFRRSFLLCHVPFLHMNIGKTCIRFGSSEAWLLLEWFRSHSAFLIRLIKASCRKDSNGPWTQYIRIDDPLFLSFRITIPPFFISISIHTQIPGACHMELW